MDDQNLPMVIQGTDLTNALAVLKSRETGLLGRTEITNYEAGAFGGLMTDIQETTIQLADGQISREEAETAFQESLGTAIRTVFERLYDGLTQPLVELIKQKFQILGKIAEAARDWGRRIVVTKVVEKTVEVVVKGWNWIKSKVKKISA